MYYVREQVGRMSQITFQEIMDFYPKHNRSVYNDLLNDCRQGGLVPFVGAGLSVFCGYLSWPDVLRQLIDFVFDEAERTRIEEMIGRGELLEAAQALHAGYPRMLKELPKHIDYAKIRDCDPAKLQASAVYLLPLLFPAGPVITTNFDRVLEEVYEKQDRKFGQTVTPYDLDLLTQARQKNPHFLFKLHGDIGPELHDADRLVFTKDQYDKVYDKGGPLMQELTRWFENKKLLFLGCSLAMDRTMEVLQAVTAENSELDHYAILACPQADMPRRIQDMGKLGISAIYYPDGRHEAVRVILEHLLEEVDPDIYKKLPRCVSLTVGRMERRFMYDAGYIAFTGRTGELAQLEAFCQSDATVSWWAVTGPGGMGKSRLVHEFVSARRKEDWAVHWLSPSEYETLDQWQPPAQRCIVVADNVQAYLQTLGEWIRSVLACRRSEKLRLLLLERDGESFRSARWGELLLADDPYNEAVSSSCYRAEFLKLPPLSEEELKTIMKNFAQASGKPLKDDDHAARLLRTLQKIDGTLQRPVYALAIADTWCSGKDPVHWDKERILNELVTRDMKFYYDRLRTVSEKKISRELRTEFETLLARSCVVPFLPLESLKVEDYPKLSKRAAEADMDFHDLLRLMGIVRTGRLSIRARNKRSGEEKEQVEYIEVVALDCPDPVKEYLVLRQALEKDKRELLLPEGWSDNLMQMMFLSRLFVNYSEMLEGQSWFWEELLKGEPRRDLSAQVYGSLLLGVTTLAASMGEGAVSRLEQLLAQFPDDEMIAATYIKGLVNLSVKQSVEDCKQGILQMERIAEQFLDSEEVADAYASGLSNLVAMQVSEERAHTISKLELLSKRFPASSSVTLQYARSLLNLTTGQELEGRQQTVDQMEVLYKQFPDSEEISAEYAKGLFNLSLKMSDTDRIQCLCRIEQLHTRFPDSAMIATAYARELMTLTNEDSLDRSLLYVRKVEHLFALFPDKNEIAMMYAEGQVFLSARQELPECMQSVRQLDTLREQFQSDEELDSIYCSSLVNLALKQTTESDVRETLRISRELLRRYPQNERIQLSYAQTLFNLTLVQEGYGRERTITELCDYLHKHSPVVASFQEALDEYLGKHPDHAERYAALRL